MTYEKHTTSTDALDTLGSVISADEKRDAIHLAVEPVQAGIRLSPGQHVRFSENGEAIWATPENGIGIVDPFLTTPVNAGEWFWLVVYPRQISSLRHVWEHPDFPPSGETLLGTMQPEPEVNLLKEAAEKWLRNWVARSDFDYTFEQLMEAIETGRSSTGTDDGYGYYSYLSYGDGYFSTGANEAYGNLSPEFWANVEMYLGHKVTGGYPEYFSCAC